MSEKFLPKGWTPQLAQQVVNHYEENLSAIPGMADTRYEQLFEPSFWKSGASRFRAGDLIHVVSANFDVELRVANAGDHGVVMETVAPGLKTQTEAKHYVLCPQKADSPHIFTLQLRTGELGPEAVWTDVAKGANNIVPLLEIALPLVTREPRSNFTFTTKPLEFMKSWPCDNPSDMMDGVQALCREGGDGPRDRWNWVYCHRGRPSALVEGRFIETQLPSKLREFFGDDPRTFEKPTGLHKPLWFRPGPEWEAREIAASSFPVPPPIPAEHEERRRAFEANRPARRKQVLAQQRAAENARFEERHSAQQREARQAITDKFN